ncbi:Major facilitator superfamily domain general substrate transporter [Penicillium atrosanguineum]|uniref:Major facilitator superfamily domain general substrate transporter n=1 Tax=Penicillium atrosanguineum TaxID=1132637 RepID=A0A9W9PT22_9EURO|nr:FAR-17a/AIG1-like protein [Penicillium atrosanguineum]KAJ5133073.1 Major facilitator superfamily domain general substrate transporter [Penicillium atrosanguineum]KAJ5141033.1 Major facilitator superfamily domain general substrate transporter [Penicillium atrosanguineum]KAJ5290744.1 FAR-17a/AIG1-like protein [Penicillium atrosanguineum]KAJ5308562.1 Major facilitator superfamily domain general substrate transporter [Penicillium atrosanguineum]
MAGAGPSVAIGNFMQDFHRSQGQVTQLLTFNFLLLGIGNMFWVPIALKFGKRTSLLVAMTLQMGALIWCALAKGFDSLLAARIVLGFAAAAGESIVPEIVADLFFLHERATMMSIYVILISCGTAVGPLVAGFMVQYTAQTWRSYFWLCVGLAAANLVLLFFFCPESNFRRPDCELDTQMELQHAIDDEELAGKLSSSFVENVSGGNLGYTIHLLPLKERLNLVRYDTSISLLRTFVEPLRLLRHPSVLWTIYAYGCSLSPQIIMIFTMSTLLTPPPYDFSSTDIGLMEIAAIIGFLVACFGGGYLSDKITGYIIRKNRCVTRPEQRLVSLLPGMFIAPAGCIVLAFACQEKLSWVAIAFGFAMVSFGEVYTPNIALTYVVHRHQKHAAQCLVLINIFKNILAFIFLYEAVPWVTSQGFTQVYMIMFMLNMLTLALAVPLYFYGPRERE